MSMVARWDGLAELGSRSLNRRTAVPLAVWLTLNTVSVVVFVRWLTGAFTLQPSAAEICALATLLAALCTASHGFFRSATNNANHWLWGAGPAFLTLFPLLVTAATTASGQSIAAAWYVGTLVCVAAAVLLISETVFRRHGAELPTVASSSPQPKMSDVPVIHAPEVPEEEVLEEPEQPEVTITDEPASPDDDVTQWMSRKTDPDGGDWIEGITTAVFQPGEKQATVHLVFSPPFARIPELTCEAVDGPPARIKTAVFCHGARLEAKRRNDVGSAARLRIGFVARTAAAQVDAA